MQPVPSSDVAVVLAQLEASHRFTTWILGGIGSAITLLVLIVAWFARDRLTSIDNGIVGVRDEVGNVKGEIKTLGATINDHTTRLALHEQQLRALEAAVPPRRKMRVAR